VEARFIAATLTPSTAVDPAGTTPVSTATGASPPAGAGAADGTLAKAGCKTSTADLENEKEF